MPLLNTPMDCDVFKTVSITPDGYGTAVFEIYTAGEVDEERLKKFFHYLKFERHLPVSSEVIGIVSSPRDDMGYDTIVYFRVVGDV